MTSIDRTKISALPDLIAKEPHNARDLQALADRATAFLRRFDWSGTIEEIFAGITIGGVIGVFLFHIDPTDPSADHWLWVVAGDVPPAYLVTDDSPNPAMALEAYIDHMTLWVDAVKRGESVDDLMPVNAPATAEYAGMLESRLNFLKDKVLSRFSDDLST